METENDEAAFSFSWLALKLLGRGLYSNPWSALSELVANGLDAQATKVYVYVDTRDKMNALVEVIDNGTGMSRADIDTYVKVGHDKRKAIVNQPGTTKPTGRKGIGKLAALFLSPHFYLTTHHLEGRTAWELDARESDAAPEEHPRLIAVPSTPSTPNDGLWDALDQGTRISILGVDLTGYGTQAVNALGARLANQFLLPTSTTPEVLLWIRTTNAETPQFAPVAKSVAFGNLSAVMTNFPDTTTRPPELAEPASKVKIPAPDLPGGSFTYVPTQETMKVTPERDEAWSELEADVDLDTRTYRGVPFLLTGWIGVHATIEKTAAQQNDTRFTKNKYYNPAQLRVYVRGKLASDHLLSQLGLTGTYANYIEGEITFDLLDDDSLPDIATSNRQDFDETDKRVMLLRAIVRPIVRALIQERTALASIISTKVETERERRRAASKQHFSAQLQADLDQHEEIPQRTRDELQMVITNKIQGDIEPKENYRIFISHARKDRAFASFIDELLRSHGAQDNEIFFTSRLGATEVLIDADALGEVVKRNITSDNTMIFYLTSKNFLASQFCLFEGGAGWATRSVFEYLKLNMEYQSIPKWLTNGRGEAQLLGDGNVITLTPELHNYIVDGILNPMISHLNRGRDISGKDKLQPFVHAEYPPVVQLSEHGEKPEDYYDSEIARHWELIVQSQVADYLSGYFSPSPEELKIRQLQQEIANLKASAS